MVEDWKKKLKENESLCVDFVEVEESQLNACESALIFNFRPICNDIIPSFPKNTRLKLKTSGVNYLLELNETFPMEGQEISN